VRRSAAALVAAVLAACAGDAPAAAPATTTAPVRAAAPSPVTTPSTTPPACPTLGPDLDPVVRRFRTADGTCAPAATASTYRCSPTAPVPVAVVGGRRHLGGPHAAVVASPPTGAVVVGSADDGVGLLVDPADPAGAYVTTPTRTERWPAVPLHLDAAGAPVEGIARPAVFVVGDSVILGAETQLRAAFGSWSVTLDAAVSRFTRDGIEVLRARRAEVADVVVIALGYNDGIDVEPFRATAAALLDELAAVPLVVWVNLRATQPYYAADDLVLLELAATRPNVVAADWAAASASLPPEAFAADGLHLTPTAAEVMADLVVGTVLGWHQRHPEQGDQSCRPALDAVLGAGG
jgi:lysophospholipase L1-like esterase